MQNDDHIITTSMDGEVSVFSAKTGKRIFVYDTIPLMIAADKENRLPEDSMQESLSGSKPHDYRPKNDDEFSNIMYISRAIKGIPG